MAPLLGVDGSRHREVQGCQWAMLNRAWFCLSCRPLLLASQLSCMWPFFLASQALRFLELRSQSRQASPTLVIHAQTWGGGLTPSAVAQPGGGLAMEGAGSQGDPHEGREAGWAGQGRAEAWKRAGHRSVSVAEGRGSKGVSSAN